MARTLDASPHVSHRPLPIADLDHGLATASAALGAIGIVCAIFGFSTGAVALGLVGFAIGLCAQMLSRTRTERFVDMAALLTCFVAFAIGAAQGGLG